MNYALQRAAELNFRVQGYDWFDLVEKKHW